MVLIPLIAGIHAVEHSCLPLRIIPRHNRPRIGNLTHRRRIPASVRLHIILCNHVESVDVAELIQSDIVRIMAGTDGIDTVSYTHLDVYKRQLRLNAGKSELCQSFVESASVLIVKCNIRLLRKAARHGFLNQGRCIDKSERPV